MKEWTTACPDWEQRIVQGKSLIPFVPLFPKEAAESMDWFRDLRIVDVSGSPTIGECCAPWVLDFAAAIFGAYDPESGKRMVREFFLLVSKKNSKSTIAAGIMLTALLRNWRNSAEFLIVAPTLEVANNSFKPASDMIAANPDLAALLHVQPHFRTITHHKTGAVLKVLAADNDTVSGKKATGVLIDEHWLFGKRPNADAMLREVTGGLVSRPEGFTIYLSTQSDEPPVGVFKQKLDYFRDVRDGKIVDNKSLGVFYEFPKAMIEAKAYLDPKNFYITNPNLGRSVSAEWLAEELAKELHGNGDTMPTFLSKHLNVEIGMNTRGDRWPGTEYWLGAAEPKLTLERLLELSDVVTLGIDGGGLDDLLGLAALGRDKKDRTLWRLWCRAWAHPIVLQRRKEIATTLKDFAKDGDLVFCKEPTQDIREVADICEQVRDAGLLPEQLGIGVDKLGLPAIVDELIERGFTLADDGGVITGVSQGGYLNPAILGAERKLSDGTLKHAGQPLMAWCVGNAKVEIKGSARAITKQSAGKAKIDPLVAAFNAVMLMARNPETKNAPEHKMFFVG